LADQDTIFCERCRSVAHAGERFIDAHYCAACELYQCDACWSESGLRCAICEAVPLEELRMPERIDSARKLLRSLKADRPPTTATVSKSAGAGAAALDNRLTAIRVESRAALGAALVAGSRSQEARRLRDDIQFERLRTISALAHRPSTGLRLNPPAPGPIFARLLRPISAWAQPRAAAPAVFGVAGAFAVVGVAVALIAVLAGGQDPVSSGVTGAQSTSTPEGAVAGNRMATPPVAPSADPGEVGGVPAMTFDELIMGRALPRAIGELVRSGRAEVAALPNAVDRSLRLVTVDGVPGEMCQALQDSPPYSIVAEILAPAPNGQRLVIRREQLGEPTEAGIEVGEEGTLIVVPDGNVLGSIPPGEWIVVELAIDTSGGMLEITTRATPGGEATSVQVAAAAHWAGAARTEFCVSSPAETNGEVYVNNLRIH
jgi:hypothetical protein